MCALEPPAAAGSNAVRAGPPYPVVRTAMQSPRPMTLATRAFWEDVWSSLEKADRAKRRGDSWDRRISELTDAAAERRIVALSQADEQDLFRTRLLQWHLERLKGRPQLDVEPPRTAMAWLPAEPWFAARALPPGPTRCTAMLLALEDTAGEDLSVRIATAEAQSREESLAANVFGAAALAERVEALAPTSARFERAVWTAAQAGRASDAQTQLRARAVTDGGPSESAHRVLAARLALAQGDELAARAELGSALALGSGEAAVLTARLLLERAEYQRARVLTRAWVDSAEGHEKNVACALWALASLPDLRGALPARTVPTPTVPTRTVPTSAASPLR